MGVEEEEKVLIKMLSDMVKSQKKMNDNLVKVFTRAIIGYTAILIAMIIGFVVYESQFEVEEKVVTTITQEVDGDEADIVNGNQYNDNATHNDYSDE